MSRLRTRYFLKDQSGVCLCVCVCLSVRGLVSAQALRTSHSFHSSREVRAGHSEGASQALSASAAESGRAPRRWGAGTARSRRGGQPAGPSVPARASSGGSYWGGAWGSSPGLGEGRHRPRPGIPAFSTVRSGTEPTSRGQPPTALLTGA